VRLIYLDTLRGMAVVWMIIFHTAYDLRMFGYLKLNFSEGFWFAFPRVIAFTFLFCVGVSIHLAHSVNIRWDLVRKRALKLGLGSIIVSVSTYIFFPEQWIFFGTLHCILTGSLLGGPFVKKRKLALAVLIIILVAQYILGYDIKWVSSLYPNNSLDFIPIYPWFWVILLGIFSAPYLSRIRSLSLLKPRPFLNYLGQNSLKIYLIHQPVIYGLIWAYTQLLS
jgi:uncharacterized membrane protein